LAKSVSERVSRSDLVDDQVSTRPAAISSSNCCSAGRSIVAPENRRHHKPRARPPAFVPLAVDEGLAGFTLCLQRIEFLVEPLLGGFAGVDRAADGSIPPGCGCWFCH